MTEQKAKNKVWKWIAGILAVLMLIGAGIALYLTAKWKPILTEKLKDGVYNRSFNLYKLDFKDVSFNLLTGSVALHEVSLRPDTAVYNQWKALDLAPANIFEVKVKKLQLSRIALLTAYFKREIAMNAVILENPSIHMIHYQVKRRPELAGKTPTLYEMISNRIRSIDINAIRIIDADFDYIDGETAKSMNSVKHLSVQVKDFLVDSLSQFDTTRYYYAKDIGFELTGYRALSKDKMYTMKVDTLKGSAVGQSLSITGFQMIPMYPDLPFSNHYTYGKDRYDLLFHKISFRGIDFSKLNSEGSIHAKALTIGPAKVNIFVNRGLPPPPNFDKVRNFPHVALKRLPLPVLMDTVLLKDIDVAYTEYNPISQQRGTVYFQNLGGNILNLTNDTVQLGKNNHAVANLYALVMKTSKIAVQIDFNLTDKHAAFHFKGNVGPMDMRVLSPMAKGMGLVELESGQLQGAGFDMQANAKGAYGKVSFLYNDLKIKLLKEGDDGEPAKKKGLLSFLANGLLIKDDNPVKGEAPRTAKVVFQRTPAASFFNLMWKSFFLGMREIVGIGAIPVKTPEEAMEKVKDKKAERQEKRAERKKEEAKKAN
jgi:hypothetical protein